MIIFNTFHDFFNKSLNVFNNIIDNFVVKNTKNKTNRISIDFEYLIRKRFDTQSKEFLTSNFQFSVSKRLKLNDNQIFLQKNMFLNETIEKSETKKEQKCLNDHDNQNFQIAMNKITFSIFVEFRIFFFTNISQKFES